MFRDSLPHRILTAVAYDKLVQERAATGHVPPSLEVVREQARREETDILVVIARERSAQLLA